MPPFHKMQCPRDVFYRTYTMNEKAVYTYLCESKVLASFAFMVIVIRLDLFKQLCSPEKEKKDM